MSHSSDNQGHVNKDLMALANSPDPVFLSPDAPTPILKPEERTALLGHSHDGPYTLGSPQPDGNTERESFIRTGEELIKRIQGKDELFPPLP